MKQVYMPIVATFLLVVTSLTVRAAEPPLPDAEIADVNGRPTILVDGRPLPPVGYSGMINAQETVQQVEAFGRHRMGFYMVGLPQIEGQFLRDDLPFSEAELWTDGQP